MALSMEFDFLLDPDRLLLSIGYQVSEGALDPSCYDLLASEARLASFMAIAKGDAPARHWFRLGHAVTPVANGAALISWSGSMFEYLMPSLVMRAPAESLIEQTNRLIVRRQIEYGGGAADALGRLGVGLQRARPGLHLPVLQLRGAGAGPEARAGRQRRVAPYATAPWRAWSTRRPPCGTSSAWRPSARAAATASTRRWTSRRPGSRTASASPSCAPSWPTTRA